jgi:hypothetical protein
MLIKMKKKKAVAQIAEPEVLIKFNLLKKINIGKTY